MKSTLCTLQSKFFSACLKTHADLSPGTNPLASNPQTLAAPAICSKSVAIHVHIQPAAEPVAVFVIFRRKVDIYGLARVDSSVEASAADVYAGHLVLDLYLPLELLAHADALSKVKHFLTSGSFH